MKYSLILLIFLLLGCQSIEQRAYTKVLEAEQDKTFCGNHLYDCTEKSKRLACELKTEGCEVYLILQTNGVDKHDCVAWLCGDYEDTNCNGKGWNNLSLKQV